MRNFVLTSTSVTDGHPDKLCDRISDAIVGSYLARDPYARVIAECAISGGIVFIAAQTHSEATVDVPAVVRETIRETGYKDAEFNPDNVTILSSVTPKSGIYGEAGNSGAEIVNTTVFGFACNHTPQLMPASIMMAHRLARYLSELRNEAQFAWLHPDGQAQVAIAYEDRKPVSVYGVTLFSALQAQRQDAGSVEARLREAVVDPVLAEFGLPLAPASRIIINPPGMPGAGGPGHHAGLTGRKNDIDCYGSYARHGGAALSGKDPSRIDRLAAYVARYAAKTVVASGLASECEVQLSYAIGESAPISVELDTFGSAQVAENRISKALRVLIDFDANAIMRAMCLSDLPQHHDGRFFSRLAAFGHFGRTELKLPWEETDKANDLAELVG